MDYIADLHVHSRYSRATARNLNLETLYIHAQWKGITVVATGDVTHPQWFQELNEKLLPAEPGLYRLKPDIERRCDAEVPPACRSAVRFILCTEISNIYKKEGKTRKGHHLIYLPDFDHVSRLNRRLEAIGNLKSDGRPILGLDARDLLEITLECGEAGFLVPAHIWTPWFSLFGSKSGFDAIGECFGDLAEHIFAVETGLSSNAPMNWRISELDTRTLVSNSDAHSPAALGRNANRFETDLSFQALRGALESHDPARCRGTIDLYPEEGKYHMDGHRKCGIWMHPAESLEMDCRCPQCGKPLTLGVLHRVAELADRPEGVSPDHALPYCHIVPLAEILSEILAVGLKSKKVTGCYHKALNALGPELDLLLTRDIDQIESAGIPLLAEAVRRMREGNIRISPGYDGAYGTITLFDPGEKRELSGQRSLFAAMPGEKSGGGAKRRPRKAAAAGSESRAGKRDGAGNLSSDGPDRLSGRDSTNGTGAISGLPADDTAPAPHPHLTGLNGEQARAAGETATHVLVTAGPGTGKTRTLTHRIAYLIQVMNRAPEGIIAVTFTNKAAREMQNRLDGLLNRTPGAEGGPFIGTFHALCLKLLRSEGMTGRRVINDTERQEVLRIALTAKADRKGTIRWTMERLGALISRCKQRIPMADLPEGAPLDKNDIRIFQRCADLYHQILNARNVFDFDDLVLQAGALLTNDPHLLGRYTEQITDILVDEFQDINDAQYRLLQLICPPGARVFAIGDPDQAIYGFRGSDIRFFRQFAGDFSPCTPIRFTRNYRSTQTILDAAHDLIAHQIAPDGPRTPLLSGLTGEKTIAVLTLSDAHAEALAIARRIEEALGGTGFHSMDFGRVTGGGNDGECALSDIAVLVRTHQQAEVIREVLEAEGIPCQTASRKHLFDLAGISELISLIRIMACQGTLKDVIRICRLDRYADYSEAGQFLFSELCGGDACRTHRGLDTLLLELPANGHPVSIQERIEQLLERLSRLREDIAHLPMTEKLARLRAQANMETSGTLDRHRREALDMLADFALQAGHDGRAFLDRIALTRDPDMLSRSVEKVSVSTLHAAKGLEFDMVVIAGCEEGFLPYEGSFLLAADPDEERRLFYVGMTRARSRLLLTRACRRTVFGQNAPRRASPFIADIDPGRLSCQDLSGSGKAGRHVQMKLF